MFHNNNLDSSQKEEKLRKLYYLQHYVFLLTCLLLVRLHRHSSLTEASYWLQQPPFYRSL